MVATKKTKKKAAAKKPTEAPDPRAPLAVKPATMEQTLVAVEAALANLERPAEPQTGDLISAVVHYVFANKLPCGYGQEVLRRIETEFVDRNEYRVTEAFEFEESLLDLDMPDRFERCRVAKDVVSQVHNDQNSVSLEFMREAPIAERKGFFMRVPAMTKPLANFVTQVSDYEEVLFSPRSTQRVQTRLGFDPKSKATEQFFARLRELVAPFGYLPMKVGPDTGDGKPILEPVLSPLCLVARLGAKS